MKRTFVVIGLSTFGVAAATRLKQLGATVVAIDGIEHQGRVEELKDKVDSAKILDSFSEEGLQEAVPEETDGAIVDIEDFRTKVEVVASLREMGITEIAVPADDDRDARPLRKIGATRVPKPYKEAGIRVAESMHQTGISEHITLGEKCELEGIKIPERLHGVTVSQLSTDLVPNFTFHELTQFGGLIVFTEDKKKYGILLTVKRKAAVHKPAPKGKKAEDETIEEERDLMLSYDLQLQRDDVIWVFGDALLIKRLRTAMHNEG